MFVFWLKKNRFLFSLACELPFKARDLVTILKETILLHILILLWKKILLSYVFEQIRACRLVTLIVRNTSSFVLKYIGIVACICQSTFNSQEYILHICHDIWLPSLTTGFRLHFSNSTFVSLHHGFFNEFLLHLIVENAFLYSAMIKRLI